MNDLQLAKKYLEDEELTLCIVKDQEVIYKSTEKGIYSLYMIITTMAEKVNGASLADKTIGKAAAMICKKLGIQSIYSYLVSNSAIDIFGEEHITFTKSVPMIMNREKNGSCPIEKIAYNTNNMEQLLHDIKEFLKVKGKLNE